MEIKITKKQIYLCLLTCLVLFGVLSIIHDVQNYFDYFSGVFIGISIVAFVFWVIIIIKTVNKK